MPLRENINKLGFDPGKLIRKWGIEFVLQEIVDYMEGMDHSDPNFVTLHKEVNDALVKYNHNKKK